jgi:hypothetical protein
MNVRRTATAVMVGLCVLVAGVLVARLDVSRGDVDAMRQAAYGLRSSSAALGAATLSVLTGDLVGAVRHTQGALPAADRRTEPGSRTE